MGLHRLREAGLLPDVFDFLDERQFTLDQLHEFCISALVFIGDKSGIKLPHPRESLTSFFQTMKMLVDKEEMQWNPVRKRLMPWIDMARLKAIHCCRCRSRDNHRSMSDPPGDFKQQKMPKKYERSYSEPPNVSANVHRQSNSTPPCNPLQHFLLNVPQMLPPTSMTVELLRCMNTLGNGNHLMKLHLMVLVVMSLLSYWRKVCSLHTSLYLYLC